FSDDDDSVLDFAGGLFAGTPAGREPEDLQRAGAGGGDSGADRRRRSPPGGHGAPRQSAVALRRVPRLLGRQVSEWAWRGDTGGVLLPAHRRRRAVHPEDDRPEESHQPAMRGAARGAVPRLFCGWDEGAGLPLWHGFLVSRLTSR